MVSYVLPLPKKVKKIKIVEYLKDGTSVFGEWFNNLDAQAAAKATAALYRLEQGNLSNVKSVGKGVLEYRIDYGPGYRIYFGREGDCLVILLGGGSKKTQRNDIKKARLLWAQYRSDRRDKR